MNLNKTVSPIKQLEAAVLANDLNKVAILFKDNNFSEQINLTKNTGPFDLACACGHIDLVKYFLTSPAVNYHPKIENQNSFGFELACMNSSLKVIHYLTSSPELNEHIHKDEIQDYYFELCLKNGKLEVLRHFVFDLNIEKTKNILSLMHQYPNDEVERMFKIRGLHNNIAKDLETSSIGIQKIPKSNKI